MVRLDAETRQRLERFSSHFQQSIAEVIRQLAAQATMEDFPPSWHLAVKENPQERNA
jgi:hypothetical protein